MAAFRIGNRWVGDGAPTYFVADISANHDGSLERARQLVRLAAESGADAAKFQNFRAEHIVSGEGFSSLGKQISHQARWRKTVFQVYQEATLPWEWTPTLKAECDTAGIDYFSTPYDLEAVEMLDPFVPVFKVGSGDITWPELLLAVARKKKPVMLATGASNIHEVEEAVSLLSSLNSEVALLQCNTNYTGSNENFKHIHLNVLNTYRVMFTNLVLGLSDHTPGCTTVLGAVALGARIIEKHFTDNPGREGPDHSFSLNPAAWREMVDRTRELEQALGSAAKRVCENERDTVVVQRRCLRATRSLAVGERLCADMLEPLRPAPIGTIPPCEIERVVGKTLRSPLCAGDALRWTLLSD